MDRVDGILTAIILAGLGLVYGAYRFGEYRIANNVRTLFPDTYTAYAEGYTDGRIKCRDVEAGKCGS